MIEEYCTNNQKIFVGYNSIKKLPKIISEFNAKNILIISSHDSYKESGAEDAINNLMLPVNISIYNNFTINPKLEEAEIICQSIQGKDIELIIAIGGGSVIDMAKIINVIQTSPQNSMKLAVGEIELEKPLIPFVAIPTTAGTGSESTHFAVVYVEGKKYSLADERILPSIAIIDPSFTLSAPAYLMACTGFDALSQGVESLWAVTATNISRSLARKAIKLIVSNLVNAIKEPENKEYKLRLAKGANLAGQAINISKTTAPHAISYPLTSYFNIPHGHAVALILGRFFRINQYDDNVSQIDEQAEQVLKDIMEEYPNLFGVDSVKECESFWYDYMLKCGLQINTVEMGIKTPEDIDTILQNINLERLQNHPVPVSYEQIKQLFKI